MTRSKSPDNIPQLKVIGLMPVKTVGDGNCLFNALSDQLHGDDTKHREYRLAVVEYIRANAKEYKPFVSLHEDGGKRRNPKRKAAGGTPFVIPTVTEEQIDAAFEERMTDMARGGTWADHLEINAFSRAFQVDIAVWSEGANTFLKTLAPHNGGANKPTLYIVHHTYAHFSSIRNIDGPFTGPPNLQAKKETAQGLAQMKREIADIEGWRIDNVLRALPDPLNQPTNRANVQATLQQCNGNMDDAINFLLPDSSPGTSSPSSIEHDAVSDDEKDQKPHKKRDRRASRPNPLRSNLAVPVPGRDAPIISPNPVFLTAALNKVAEDEKKIDPDETEVENWKDHMFDESSVSPSSSASRYSSPAPKGSNADVPKVRVHLSQPKLQGRIRDIDVHSDASSQSSQSNIADTEADPDYTTKSTKKKISRPRKIAQPRRRLMPGNQRAVDSDNGSRPPAMSHVNLLGRTNSMKKLDSSIEAIHI